MHVYSSILLKGGTGKTALAVNLAAALAQVSLRVLLIDLDPQANASHWLGVDRADLTPEQSFLGVVSGQPLAHCIRSTVDGVDLVPAHRLMASLPVHLAAAPGNGLFVLRKALATLPQAQYDVVLLDLPPTPSPVMATALAATTRCIAPVQCQDLVLRALTELVESVEQAREFNPALGPISVVRNMYSVRSAGDRIYDGVLREAYSNALLNTVIPVRAALRDAAALQQSVFRYTGGDGNEVRDLFLRLVDELIALDGEQ